MLALTFLRAVNSEAVELGADESRAVNSNSMFRGLEYFYAYIIN